MTVDCDQDGWVYSDHKWSNPVGASELHKAGTNGQIDNTKTLTRRRRWYRKAIPIHSL